MHVGYTAVRELVPALWGDAAAEVDLAPLSAALPDLAARGEAASTGAENPALDPPAGEHGEPVLRRRAPADHDDDDGPAAPGSPPEPPHDGPARPAPPRIDAMVHIGMAGPRLHYCIERLAHRDGYAMKDVDGELLGDEERHAREGAAWIWHGLPAELETDFDVVDVLRRWRGYSPVRPQVPYSSLTLPLPPPSLRPGGGQRAHPRC